MIFTILTLFPNIFHSPLQESIIKKAFDKGLINFNIIDIRDFAGDVHKTCDDKPYGGGPGMVMKIEPIYRAMEFVEKTFGRPRYVLLTPQGRPFDQATAERYGRLAHVCLVCGRYEGVDERVIDCVDEEVSIGDYVLSGGEIPALVLIDAISRNIPGVVGNEGSVADESFREPLLEYPQYTRPETFMDMEVPPVLLSGNHEQIRRWRRKEAIRKTFLKRPDLINRFTPTEEDGKFIKEIMEEIPE
ncbi:MAG: tRNA (guanosine(37)-N1)-methyltransferase TrmD [Syntrophorhabdaceae bacterium]|jgi:tRNA (guanine37-N1)-methyltransferase|nr:tRNA (guanosine(37)-N1)-methyltransferase TrmD [Syntrophorhabdaceae bacterium]MDD5244631.1 tRNA (guanosine(37)-N1)-methyltransferase TrmD [Syntrophorhabdaceae bacterium]